MRTERVGIYWTLNCLGCKLFLALALASLVAISGLKKSRFSGPTPSNGPRNGFAPIKIIKSRVIWTTGTWIVILDTFQKEPAYGIVVSYVDRDLYGGGGADIAAVKILYSPSTPVDHKREGLREIYEKP